MSTDTSSRYWLCCNNQRDDNFQECSDFENKSYYPSGPAATIASAWIRLSERADDLLSPNSAHPAHVKVAKCIGSLLRKLVWVALERTASLFAKSFEKKIDGEVYQEEFWRWDQVFPAIESETRERYIDALVRAKISSTEYKQVDPATFDLLRFFSGMGLEDPLRREELERSLAIEVDHTKLKKYWVPEEINISTASDEKKPVSLSSRIWGMLFSSEKRVIFNINKSDTIVVYEEDDEVTTSFSYNIYLEDSLDSCNSVVFNIDGKIKQLPQNRSLNLIKKIQDTRAKRFCCIDFTNSICGKFTYLCELKTHDWMFYPDPKKYSVGDVVAIGTDEQVSARGLRNFEHYAVYVGSKTFMSLYGSCPLVFSTLEQMKKVYEVQGTVLMKPLY